MFISRIPSWRDFITEGEQYLQTAVYGAEKRPEVFTPEILYNIAAMAIEKYFMGLLMLNNDMADNHTMADLVSSVERHVPVPPRLRERLFFLDSFQEICDLEGYQRRAPAPEEMPGILDIGRDVERFVRDQIQAGCRAA